MRYQTLFNIIKSRVSCRNYADRPVADELINQCLEAARLAPSACNKQPWRFIVVKDAAIRQAIARRGLLPALPMPWVESAPVIVVLCVKSSFVVHKVAPLFSGVDYPLVDAGIAGEHFVLAAESLNLGSCWIGWFKEKQIKKLLKIPHSVKVVSLFTLGYPAKAATASQRLPLAEIVSNEYWTLTS